MNSNVIHCYRCSLLGNSLPSDQFSIHPSPPHQFSMGAHLWVEGKGSKWFMKKVKRSFVSTSCSLPLCRTAIWSAP